MIQNQDEILRKLHNLQLKIAIEIKRICDKNGIKYFIIAGTLLGAVRHGGFIPWDDDFDIGILRRDYNKFLEACKSELSDYFYLQTWDTDPEYPFSYGKIRLKGTRIIESFSEKANIHNGIFVDIFPFDNVPNKRVQKLIQGLAYFSCKRLLWIKKGMGQNMKKNRINACRYYLFKILSQFFNYNSIKKFYETTQIRYNDKESNEVVTDGSYNYRQESLPKKWLDNLEMIPFETEEFYAFKDRIDYLTYFYGDFLKLPPTEKRNRHLVQDVDFGNY
ncbi:MAG TPA: LicD family protein [Desulfobacteraceae bacterium]|nr:LicD family protein [Desulfobacteraceae bacterium]HPQ27206.1 LicD family protein [Desulfobacteraceae bacterium]